MLNKEVFVCEASYNIYIPLLKAVYNYRNNVKTIIILSDDVCDNKKLAEKVSLLKFIDKVIYIEYKKEFSNTKSKFIKKLSLLFYKKKLLTIFDGKYNFYLKYYKILNNSRINLFWGYHPLMIKHNNLKFIEEGNGVYYVNRRHRLLKSIVRKIVGLPDINGTDENVKEVEVSYPDKLIKELQKKAAVLNIKSLEENLTIQEKHEILSLYFNDEYKFKKRFLYQDNLAIIITQPFSEDGDLTEDAKIKIYKNVMEKLSLGHYKVLIKAHPREKTNYAKIFNNKNVIILPKEFPLELINLLGNKVKLGITVSSTALKNLNCVEKKIFLKKFLEETNYV